MIIYSKRKLLKELKSCYKDYCSHPENNYYYSIGLKNSYEDTSWDRIDISENYSFNEFIRFFCLTIGHMRKNNSYGIQLCSYEKDKDNDDDNGLHKITKANWKLIFIFPFVQMICKHKNWNDIL